MDLKVRAFHGPENLEHRSLAPRRVDCGPIGRFGRELGKPAKDSLNNQAGRPERSLGFLGVLDLLAKDFPRLVNIHQNSLGGGSGAGYCSIDSGQSPAMLMARVS